ncbi:MAG: aldo/keto reductase [Deltaproteobacteria bacterium]|nr:aldo/keto reductase [Deltaproteobacteria bacterium]
MKTNPLGKTALRVSEIGMGTMTFGEQNTAQEAALQLDRAVAAGINFVDTAEMYPVPGKPETQGRTEEYVGRWLKGRPRDSVVLASKVAGPSRGFAWLRGGPAAVDRVNIRQALEGSLKRLQTDYLDLYQIHWPDRYVPMFGQTTYDPAREKPTIPIAEQLEALAGLVREGRVRHIGLSNETPWGVTAFARAAREAGLPEPVSIQNAYSLINRTFETGLAEVCRHEGVSLLAYSPLGFGMLSGKYAGSPQPPNPQPTGRITLFPQFTARYAKPNTAPAAEAYARLAQKAGVAPAVLALAFVRSRWFVTSTIIGATTLVQLEENLSSLDYTIPPEVLAEIEAVHTRYPNPAP